MERKNRKVDDPIVEEVRAVRAAIWREAGGTAEGLIRLLDERRPFSKDGHDSKVPPKR